MGLVRFLFLKTCTDYFKRELRSWILHIPTSWGLPNGPPNDQWSAKWSGKKAPGKFDFYKWRKELGWGMQWLKEKFTYRGILALWNWLDVGKNASATESLPERGQWKMLKREKCRKSEHSLRRNLTQLIIFMVQQFKRVRLLWLRWCYFGGEPIWSLFFPEQRLKIWVVLFSSSSTWLAERPHCNAVEEKHCRF